MGIRSHVSRPGDHNSPGVWQAVEQHFFMSGVDERVAVAADEQDRLTNVRQYATDINPVQDQRLPGGRGNRRRPRPVEKRPPYLRRPSVERLEMGLMENAF